MKKLNIIFYSFLCLIVFILLFNFTQAEEDVTPPTLEIYTVSENIISPNNSLGIKDSVIIDIKFSEPVKAFIQIRDASDNLIEDIYSPPYYVTNPQEKTWYGKDGDDNYVIDGEYTIVISGIDSAGNELLDNSHKIIVDNTNPIIVLDGENPTVVYLNDIYNDAGATANDNDDDLTDSIVTISTVDTSILGEYSVSYDFVDSAGNSAEQVIRVVQVQEPIILESITISHPADKLIYQIGEALDITGLEITGNYSDDNTQIEIITADNISGFDSSTAVAGQVLTITIGDKTITYSIDIEEEPEEISETRYGSMSGSMARMRPVAVVAPILDENVEDDLILENSNNSFSNSSSDPVIENLPSPSVLDLTSKKVEPEILVENDLELLDEKSQLANPLEAEENSASAKKLSLIIFGIAFLGAIGYTLIIKKPN